MPVHIDSHDETGIDVTPGTNRARVLRLLYANTELGFTPKEIAHRTDINHDSVYTALSRLRSQGLIGRTADGYYHALDDNDDAVQVAHSLRSSSDVADQSPDLSDGEEDIEGDPGTGFAADPRAERRTGGTGSSDPAGSSAPQVTEPADDEASMPDSRSSVEPDGSESLSPDEAFALLGNDTRVGILQVLWDAFESGRGGNAVTYSDLFEQVDYDDSGNFSYHIEKLTGPFVRKTDGGYELKQTGINVVRAVVAGTVTADSAVGPAVVDVDCPLCAAPVEIDYADEFMNITCTACAGRSRWGDESGHLFGALVPPRGVDQHSVEEVFRAAVTSSLNEISIFHEGVCPHCLGPVETTVDACSDHDSAGNTHCPNCDRFNMADVSMVCSTCKRSIPPSVTIVALDHPEVTAFYHDHDIEHRFATWETVARSFDVGEELISEDPLRMAVTIPAGDDELRLVLDGEVDVRDVSR